MGYTHHYYVETYDMGAFRDVAYDFLDLVPHLAKAGVTLAGIHGSGQAEIRADMIRFNGVLGEKFDQTCEPFMLEWTPRVDAYRKSRSSETDGPSCLKGKTHQYTKTNHRPYDLAVTACLVIAKHHLGDGIIVESNGTEEQWSKATRLCQEHLGYGNDFRLDDPYGARGSEPTKRLV